MFHYTALVTILAVLFYLFTATRVSRARRAYGVVAPAMIGHPDFERVVRVHANTLEWMPIFLPLLWLCAYYESDALAALLGLIWIAARILYMVSYTKSAAARGPGFAIQGIVCGLLLVAALIGIVRTFLYGG